MTEGDALLRAIIEEPDCNDLRLIYADWLGDNGQDARAEFIRLQIAVWEAERDCLCGRKGGGHGPAGGQHHNGPCAGDQVRVEGGQAHRLASLLLDGNAAEWFAAFAPHGQISTRGALWRNGQAAICRRGFLEEISLDCARLDVLPAVAKGQPLRRVVLIGKRPVSVFNNTTFQWVRSESYSESWCLAGDLFDRLRDADRVGRPEEDWAIMADYRSADRALADLSQACIRWARGEA